MCDDTRTTNFGPGGGAVEKGGVYAGVSCRAQRLEAALRTSMTAIDDWLNTYAPDLCDPWRVAEALRRIGEAGATLAYIADVQDANRKALIGESADPQPATAKQVAPEAHAKICAVKEVR